MPNMSTVAIAQPHYFTAAAALPPRAVQQVAYLGARGGGQGARYYGARAHHQINPSQGVALGTKYFARQSLAIAARHRLRNYAFADNNAEPRCRRAIGSRMDLKQGAGHPAFEREHRCVGGWPVQPARPGE